MVEDPETFYKCVNEWTQAISTEADELQYNLHVMLRFDLEKSLISGDLNVSDVELGMNGLRQILVTKSRSHLKEFCKTFIGRQELLAIFRLIHSAMCTQGAYFKK